MNKNLKCVYCNREHDHFYKNKQLCKYHYWIARGRPKDEHWKHVWKEYRYLHPVRVSCWRKQDLDFNNFLERLIK